MLGRRKYRFAAEKRMALLRKRGAGITWSGESGRFQTRGETHEPLTAAKFFPGFLEQATKIPNQEQAPKTQQEGAGVTWSRGDPQQIRARRKACREKERRNAKFEVEKPPGEAAEVVEKVPEAANQGSRVGRVTKQTGITGAGRR